MLTPEIEGGETLKAVEITKLEGNMRIYVKVNSQLM